MSGGETLRAVVEASSLTVRYGAITALDSVSFALPRGQVVGLVGPNGAGKTTLLKVLSTLLVPLSGRAMVDGFDVVRAPTRVRQRIGYLPDFSGLYHDMRVDEYLDFFGRCFGLDRAQRAAFLKRALDLAGLTDRATSFVEELSLGMRAKLAFVRSLAGDPSVLLLDEPFSSLDPITREDFLMALRGLAAEGKTVLISSHQLADLEKVTDSVMLIDEGRLVSTLVEPDAAHPKHEIHLAGEREGALDLLGGLAGVVEVSALGDGARFELTLAPSAEAAAVLRAAVLAGLEVSQFKPSGRRLEQRLRDALEEDAR